MTIIDNLILEEFPGESFIPMARLNLHMGLPRAIQISELIPATVANALLAYQIDDRYEIHRQ